MLHFHGLQDDQGVALFHRLSGLDQNIDNSAVHGGRDTTATAGGGTAGRLLPESGKLGYAAIVQTPDEIVREIRRQIKSGCDWIKVHVSGLPVRRTPMHGSGEIQAWTLDELLSLIHI